MRQAWTWLRASIARNIGGRPLCIRALPARIGRRPGWGPVRVACHGDSALLIPGVKCNRPTTRRGKYVHVVHVHVHVHVPVLASTSTGKRTPTYMYVRVLASRETEPVQCGRCDKTVLANGEIVMEIISHMEQYFKSIVRKFAERHNVKIKDSVTPWLDSAALKRHEADQSPPLYDEFASSPLMAVLFGARSCQWPNSPYDTNVNEVSVNLIQTFD